jgi:primosomal protein N'
MRFCKIAITNSSQSFQNRLEDGLLSYSIPEEINEEVAVGSMVLVPFRNQKENGIVIDIYNSGQESHSFKVRNILETIYPDDFISQELIELTKFTADYYACNINEVCSAIFPSAIIKKPQKTIILEDSETKYEHPRLFLISKFLFLNMPLYDL